MNVNVVVPTAAVLIVAGNHVPVMAGVLVELVESVGAVLFWQSGPIGAKVGVMLLVIVISSVTTLAH